MQRANLCRIARGLLATAVSAFALGAAGRAVHAQEEELVFERDPTPKLFVTDFAWYRPNLKADGGVEPRSLACANARPLRALGEITATDYLSSDGYYGEKYKRFKSYGVDGIAYLVTDRVPDSFEGANTLQLAELATAAGLDFFAYYDLFINTTKTSRLFLCLPGGKCRASARQERVPSYNMAARPQLYDQLRDDFEAIARHLVVPHMDGGGPGYLMLEDVDGRRVLDEAGLPRPVIAITIAREFSDGKANLRRIGELMEELTGAFRALGVGKPALVLDVIFWVTPRAPDFDHPYDPDLLEAFGDYAVAITRYGFFDSYRGGLKGITNDGPRPPIAVWGRYLNQHYRLTRDALAADRHALMIWPAAQTQLEAGAPDVPGCPDRGIELSYHLRSAEDWRTMLSRVLVNGWRPVPAEGAPLKTLALVTNAGEWYEAGAIDFTGPDASGECSFPFHWCESLLEVVKDEDLYRE
jgi:hypothetical protein